MPHASAQVFPQQFNRVQLRGICQQQAHGQPAVFPYGPAIYELIPEAFASGMLINERRIEQRIAAIMGKPGAAWRQVHIGLQATVAYLDEHSPCASRTFLRMSTLSSNLSPVAHSGNQQDGLELGDNHDCWSDKG